MTNIRCWLSYEHCADAVSAVTLHLFELSNNYLQHTLEHIVEYHYLIHHPQIVYDPVLLLIFVLKYIVETCTYLSVLM